MREGIANDLRVELRAIARYGSTAGMNDGGNIFWELRAIARYGSTAGISVGYS